MPLVALTLQFSVSTMRIRFQLMRFLGPLRQMLHPAGVGNLIQKPWFPRITSTERGLRRV
jgi:hypothetical protein